MHNYGSESKAREWDNTHMCERFVVYTLLTYFLVNSNFCFEQLFTRITDHHKLVVEVCEGVVVVVFLWIHMIWVNNVIDVKSQSKKSVIFGDDTHVVRLGLH